MTTTRGTTLGFQQQFLSGAFRDVSDSSVVYAAAFSRDSVFYGTLFGGSTYATVLRRLEGG